MSTISKWTSGETVKRWGRWALILLLAWPLLAWLGARALIVNSELAHADALAVLAGSSTYLERTHRAAQLFQEGRAQLIVLTNDNLKSEWSNEQQRNPLFVERAVDELKRQGVPADRIEIVPGAVFGTYDEVVRLRDYAGHRDLRSVLVVTSPYQTRRALWTLQRVFRASDITIGIDGAEPGQQSPRPETWWWHRFGWKLVPGEYVKIIYYWMKH
jgi:uncharacterized SAM-binding protein YcdF (DUF218 family)